MAAEWVVTHGRSFLSGLALGLRRKPNTITIEYEQKAKDAMHFDSEAVARVFANVVSNASGSLYGVAPYEPPPKAAAPMAKKARKR